VIERFSPAPVALIVRHPLDALVSLWMQQRHRTATGYDGDFAAFARDPVFGLDKALRFHALWAGERGRPRGLHLVRYEDLRADAAGGLRAILDFAGIPIDEAAVAHAVEASSFASMRRLEEAGAGPRYRSSGASVFATGDQGEPNAFHVRRGEVGGYREHLTAEDATEFEAAIAEHMSPWYGYGGG
jgi:hypothetical protein